MDRRALWKALRSRGIPDVVTDLIAGLHENTGAAIRVGKNKSSRLETTSGVRQGCILAPALFCVAIDWILNHMTLVLSILLYASETWTSLASDMKAIESFHMVSAKDPWNQVA